MPLARKTMSASRSRFSNAFDEEWFKDSHDLSRRKAFSDAVANERAAGNLRFFTSYRTRNSRLIKERYGVDLLRILKILVRQKRGEKVEMLDIGTGYMFLPPDVKAVFGNKVKVTALGLNPSDVTSYEIVFRQKLKELEGNNTAQGKAKKEELLHSLEVVEKFKENLRSVDSYVFSVFENFVPEKKYDLLVDIYGPSVYSEYPHRVEEQYFNLSRIGSLLVTTASGKHLVSRFGPNSPIALKTGTCFVPLRINKLGSTEVPNELSVLRKVSLNTATKNKNPIILK
jgi:hypothetical protein